MGLEVIPYMRQFGEGELIPCQNQALLCEFLLQYLCIGFTLQRNGDAAGEGKSR
jgi:hypothetical protein